MKSFCNDDNNNWLGFSLSPYMKMSLSDDDDDPHQADHHQTQQQNHVSSATTTDSVSVSVSVPNSSPSSFFHLNYGANSNICYEGDENGVLYTHMPVNVMPLKSDGSLCIMEALNRSHPTQQGMVTSSTPKLEDFFGVASMGTHHYENNETEAMALSLDSMYYHQNQNQNQTQNNEPDNQICLNQQQQHNQIQNYTYYTTGIRTTEVTDSCNLQLPLTTMGGHGHGHGHGMSEMKNWVSLNYPTDHEMQLGCMASSENNGESLSSMSYGDLHSLSLSMSPGSQSSCVTGSQHISPEAMETRKRGMEKVDQKQVVHRKSIDTFGQRTSQYRGVTRHRWTGRYEAHLWDNSCKKEGQSRKGRQVYLGGYDMEEKAARAYDLAALKYWGAATHINFTLEDYQKEVEDMKNMSRQEYVAHLRRRSSGFSRGASIYRGVTRHHQHGRWQARIGRVAGNKDLYLGTFSTQEEAAEAYDVAAIKFRSVNAVTNFDISRYDVERIMESNTLLAGEHARKHKEITPTNYAAVTDQNNINNNMIINVEKETFLSHKNNVETQEPNNVWNMGLYQHQQPSIVENYKTQNHSFALAPLNDNVDIGVEDTTSQEVDGSNKMATGTTHLSNASSLVTSLNSSREGSPTGDRTTANYPMLFGGNNNNNNVNVDNITQASGLNTWVPMPQMPVFAAWTDA